MALKVYLDGEFVSKEDAKLSVYDHGVLYGDGIFEGIRVYAGKIFEVEHHVRRLYESAKAIRLEIPIGPAEITAAMEKTVKANNFTDCYIRLIVTRGVGNLGISPIGCEPSIVIIADTIRLYPQEMYETGMAVITSSVMRNHPNALSARIKSLNYLNNILAKIEAIDAGVPEAIMLNPQGYVAECTADNIFLVRAGQILTPPASEGALEGVTRAVIIKLCDQLNIPLTQQRVERHDLYIADECFLTGSAAEVMGVTKIDGRSIGDGKPGPITATLKEAFHRYARGG